MNWIEHYREWDDSWRAARERRVLIERVAQMIHPTPIWTGCVAAEGPDFTMEDERFPRTARGWATWLVVRLGLRGTSP